MMSSIDFWKKSDFCKFGHIRGFARTTTIFNSLVSQLVKYDIHTTSKIKFIHAICYHILLFYCDIFAPFYLRASYTAYTGVYSCVKSGCVRVRANVCVSVCLSVSAKINLGNLSGT